MMPELFDAYSDLPEQAKVWFRRLGTLLVVLGIVAFYLWFPDYH